MGDIDSPSWLDAAWDGAWRAMCAKVEADFPSWQVLHGPYGYFATRGDSTVRGRTTAVIREKLTAAQRSG